MQQHQDLTAILPQETTVIVIGDVCLDEYLHGSVSRVALDCPVPVFSASGSRFYPGLASNMAQNIANLGEHFGTYLLGVVGNEDKGSQLRDLVSASPRIAPFLYRISGRPTCHKCRVVAQGNLQVLRIDNETATPIPRKAEEALLKEFRSTLPHVQGIICSDNRKCCLTPRLLQNVITAARAAALLVIIDPKCEDPERFHGSTIIKPN
jgi:D-beta-D-heptose 7-phosphate kinase / D-beta-D-heptose 1-phosphate adenosyltransferase